MRTAVYLWARQHPEDAARLLNDATYSTAYLVPVLGTGFGTLADFLTTLSDQVNLAVRIVETAQRWLTVPASPVCDNQAVAARDQFSQIVAMLLTVR